MKILFISKSNPVLGGVEVWMDQLITGLLERSHDIYLALADGNDFHDSEKYLSNHPCLLEAKIRRLSCGTGMAYERHRSIEQLLTELSPDIVIPVMLHEALGAVSSYRAKGGHAKVVYPVHEEGVWVKNSVLEYADVIDAVVSVNRLMLLALAGFADWPANRSFHIRAGVKRAHKLSSSRQFHQPFTIGYCGRLDKDHKRADDLVAFCYALDRRKFDYRLLIAGQGGEEQDIYQSLDKHLNQERVIRLGQIPHAQLNQDFYPIIEALIITSEWETGPLVAWEAMMHGVLVITSEYRGLKTERILVPDENALVYPQGKMEYAAEMLVDNLSNKKLIKHIAKCGQQTAEEYLSLDYMITQWELCLENVYSMNKRIPRTGHHYTYNSNIKDLLFYLLRRYSNRPVKHGNAHFEWPRFKPGPVSRSEILNFIEVLKQIELDSY